MTPVGPESGWHIRLIQPRFILGARILRPAELGNSLLSVMLGREYLLEDVDYIKIVPNRYVVEVSEENYARNFRPIESRVVQQWRDKMLEHLMTANSRQGRREYRFGGSVQILIRPAPDLQNSQARLYFRIETDGSPPAPLPPIVRSIQTPPSAPHRPDLPASSAPVGSPPAGSPLAGAPQPGRPAAAGRSPAPAGIETRVQPGGPSGNPFGAAPSTYTTPAAQGCLELQKSAQPPRRWPLRPGITTLGRNVVCDIHLTMPDVQEKRLVSGQHAYVLTNAGEYRVFDGTPGGRSSVNGTYVNGQRLPPEGAALKNGDLVTLAALDPNHPRPDDPGVVSFRFWLDCEAWT